MGRCAPMLHGERLLTSLKVTQVVCEVASYISLHSRDVAVSLEQLQNADDLADINMLKRSASFLREVSFAFWLVTLLMLMTACIMRQHMVLPPGTMFGFIYHIVGAALLLLTAFVLIVGSRHFLQTNVHCLLAAMFAIVSAILHIIHAVISFMAWWRDRKKRMTLQKQEIQQQQQQEEDNKANVSPTKSPKPSPRPSP